MLHLFYKTALVIYHLVLSVPVYKDSLCYSLIKLLKYSKFFQREAKCYVQVPNLHIHIKYECCEMWALAIPWQCPLGLLLVTARLALPLLPVRGKKSLIRQALPNHRASELCTRFNTSFRN